MSTNNIVVGMVINTAKNFRNTESTAGVEIKIEKKNNNKLKRKQKTQCLILTEGRKPLKNK